MPFTSIAADTPYKLPTALSIEKPARLSGAKLNVLADSAAIPSWSNTAITATDASLPNTAIAAINKLLTYLDSSSKTFTGIGWWQSANAYWEILNHDLLRSTSNFASTRTALAQLIAQGPPSGTEGASSTTGLRNVYNDDTLWWSLAASDAYSLSKSTTFITEAEKLWGWVNDTSVIIQTGIAPNMGGVKRTEVLSTACSLEGGVYWTTHTTETYVNSITTGLFFLQSARIYEFTKEVKWLNHANKALQWLQRHTVDARTLVVDGVNGKSCSVSSQPYTYNTGIYIGGLVSLYKSTGNTSYLTEAEEAGVAAMETTVWTDGAGMITEEKGATSNSDGAGFRSIMIRNLVQLFKTTSNTDIKQEIKGFVNVNYNSLYKNARSGNNYDGNWFGPFTTPQSWGQMAAVDVLNAGMIVNAWSQRSATTAPEPKSSKKAAGKTTLATVTTRSSASVVPTTTDTPTTTGAAIATATTGGDEGQSTGERPPAATGEEYAGILQPLQEMMINIWGMLMIRARS